MFHYFEKAILGMAILRVLSGSLEVFVGLFILKLNNVEKALVVNSSLVFVGPVVLILTTTIGLLGMADKISLTKIFWVFSGVICILYGVMKSN
ncbi:MAG TPA: YqhV family protein [Pseudoneobacillus sp.]|jgi:putative exporter of polyketide antibiotics|nr:YqhV family protein [Pseudoneobacillus sp.]